MPVSNNIQYVYIIGNELMCNNTIIYDCDYAYFFHNEVTKSIAASLFIKSTVMLGYASLNAFGI